MRYALLLVLIGGACRQADDPLPARRAGAEAGSTSAAADPHAAELAALQAFEERSRAATDFARQPTADRAFGPNPYRVAWLDGERAVGLLRGAAAVVLLDRDAREVSRAPAPPSPTALAVDDAGRVWVGGTGSPEIAVYQLAKDGAALTEVTRFELAGARAVRALAAGDGFVYAADQETGRVAALAIGRAPRGRRVVAAQREIDRCRQPIALAWSPSRLVIDCLIDHEIVAHRLEGGLPSGEPTRIRHDGPVWSIAIAASGDRTLLAAGGVEDHPLERKDGGFRYIDSFLYLYELGGPGTARRLEAVNLSAEGVVTPKWITLEVDGDRARVSTAGYATSVLASLTFDHPGSGAAPRVLTRAFWPGTTDLAVSPGGRLAASELLDAWLPLAPAGAPRPVSPVLDPAAPARSPESRVGEALFFTTLMAPWNDSEGPKSRFTCETCHFEAYGDGRVHFTGRGTVHAATKPLRGLWNNRPHFTRALDRTTTKMVHAEFRVANRWAHDPWFEIGAREVPWLAAIDGAPARMAPTFLRRAFMTFLMELTFEPNPAARGRRRFDRAERAGAELFRDRCESCHRARLVAEDATSAVPFDRWEEHVFAPQGAIVWASAEYQKTGVEPYVEERGARTTALRRLRLKQPYFTSGSARTVMDVLDGAAWQGGRFWHAGAPDGAERLAAEQRGALAAFLDLL